MKSALLAALLGLVGVVAGCGGQEEEQQAPSGSTQKPAQTTVQEPMAQSQEEDTFTPVIASFVGGDTAAVKGTDDHY